MASRKCLIWGCKKSDGVMYHRISKSRYKEWMIAIGRNPEEKLSYENVLCSKHFSSECYVSESGGKKKLKADAIPTLMLRVPASKNCNSSSTLKETNLINDPDPGPSLSSSSSSSINKQVFSTTSSMNNLSYNDLENICRTCMLNCDLKFALDNVLSDVFYKLTDINFETNDELPQQICLKCFEKINDIHEFAFKCKRTHLSLVKCINNLKNAQMNEKPNEEENDEQNKEQNDEQKEKEKNEPIKFEEEEEEITIDEHVIDFLKVEVSNSTSEYVNDELELNEDIEEDKNNESEENMIPETSNVQNINCSEDDVLKQYFLNIEAENDDSNDVVNLSNPDEDIIDISDSSSAESPEDNEEISRKTKHNPNYKCDVCNKTYIQFKAYKKHKSLTSCERPYQCEHCLKSFKHINHLKMHRRTHTGECPYKCELCPKSFPRPYKLKIHMRTHSGERPYECEQCSRTFSLSYSLKLHLRTHNGERPYKCEQCPKTFVQSSNLRIHMRTHSGERPHVCDQCSKSFTSSSDLNSHKRTHSGECPYQCELCTKAYPRLQALKNHMRTHSC